MLNRSNAVETICIECRTAIYRHHAFCHKCGIRQPNFENIVSRSPAPTRLVYIDDSSDDVYTVYSALIIPAHQWRECFDRIKRYRKSLMQLDGIRVHKELHAWEFVKGKGRLGKPDNEGIVTRARRCEIFKEVLMLAAAFPEVKLLNCAFPRRWGADGFERLVNRINRNAQAANAQAILICDEGSEEQYTKLIRRMGVHNYISSHYGAWGDGASAKNIPIAHVLDDPFFKRSDRSYFVQMADFCAYALLRHKRPTEYTLRYELQDAYNLLSPLFVPEACKKDVSKRGIIVP